MRRILGAASAFLLVMLADANAQSPAPTQVGTYGSWSAYTLSDKRGKQCYVMAQPSDMQPKNVSRDPVYFLVTTRPADNVKNEASVIIGYPLKDDSRVSIEIGPQKFSMFTKDDGAWIETAALEDSLVAAMKAGASMVVKGTSRRGTATTDTYPLSGITAALGKMVDACK